MPESEVKEGKKLASPSAVARVYWQHTRTHAWLFALVIVGDIGMQAADLISPWFMRTFFNSLAGAHPSPALAGHLLGIVGIIAAISLSGWAFRRLQSRSIMALELEVMRDLTMTAFAYLIEHSYNFFISHFAGTLTHKVNRFSRVYESLLDAIMLQFFPTLVFVIGAIVVLYLRHPVLGVALAVWSVLLVLFQIWVANLRQPKRALRAEQESKTTGAIADTIGNHSNVMLFSGFAHERGILAQATTRLRDITRDTWFSDDWVWASMGLFMVAINIGMLIAATILWGKGMLTIGDFVLIQTYLLGTFDRLFSINRELRRFYDALADAEEMVYILELPHEITDISGAQPLRVTAGAIAFDHTTFAFNQGASVLEDFSLAIKSREKVALVGPSGAGKSTITKLLLRHFDVGSGAIMIDGQDIAKVTQESLRNAIAFVPQEPILFHRSLLENIRYGRRDATDAEVIEAAKSAHCHEFISQLQLGYDTHVGERGVKLSGGERQRVAIARAILKNAPILVLDEATSSLDSESEALIQDALALLMEGKTVVVIAHRLSTIMRMDRIVVIEGGRAIADGTHAELLAQGGLYHKLWSIQAGGFLKDEDESETKVPPINA